MVSKLPPLKATVLEVDFSKGRAIFQHKSGVIRDRLPKRDRPRTRDGKLLTKKQIRTRARRRAQKTQILTDEEGDYLYEKPLEEWDLEELAHGRPRNKKGHFKGPSPMWITPAVQEASRERFVHMVRNQVYATTGDALQTLTDILKNEDVDGRGRPIVAAGTKLDAAKFLIEHVIGKPTQRIENDVSVKLQGILGAVMVNPSDMPGGGYELGHFPGITMPMATRDDIDHDELEAEVMNG